MTCRSNVNMLSEAVMNCIRRPRAMSVASPSRGNTPVSNEILAFGNGRLELARQRIRVRQPQKTKAIAARRKTPIINVKASYTQPPA